MLTITPYRMTQCCLQPKRLFVPYVSSKKDRMERISPPTPNHRLLSNITSTTCCSGSKPLILSALLLVLTFFRQIPSLLLHPVRERWLLCLWSRSTSLQQEVLYSCNIGSILIDQRWSEPPTRCTIHTSVIGASSNRACLSILKGKLFRVYCSLKINAKKSGQKPRSHD